MNYPEISEISKEYLKELCPEKISEITRMKVKFPSFSNSIDEIVKDLLNNESCSKKIITDSPDSFKPLRKLGSFKCEKVDYENLVKQLKASASQGKQELTGKYKQDFKT